MRLMIVVQGPVSALKEILAVLEVIPSKTADGACFMYNIRIRHQRSLFLNEIVFTYMKLGLLRHYNMFKDCPPSCFVCIVAM